MARPSHYPRHRSAVLQAIFDAQASHAQPPTVRDLARQTGVAVATMHSYLELLAAEGLITWKPRARRSVHCTQTGWQAATAAPAEQS